MGMSLRSRTKPKAKPEEAVWRVSRIRGNRAVHVTTLLAMDQRQAIARVAKAFKMDADDQRRLFARPQE